MPFVCAVVGTGMPARAASFSQSAFATPGPPLKILGFGDSLTAGWHDNGMTLTPYAPALETALRDILGPVMVRHKGLPGESLESKAKKANFRRRTTDTRVVMQGGQRGPWSRQPAIRAMVCRHCFERRTAAYARRTRCMRFPRAL